MHGNLSRRDHPTCYKINLAVAICLVIDLRTVILVFIFEIFFPSGKASDPAKFRLSRQIFKNVVKQDGYECPPKRNCDKGLVT